MTDLADIARTAPPGDINTAKTTSSEPTPPRVFSERGDQILEQIREVFIEKGFEQASMQALAIAAAMSVGNFYRYFPSKDAIIAALIERDLQMMEGAFDLVRHADDPREAFRAIVTARMRTAECESGPMLIEIESAALRHEPVRDALRRADEAIEKNLLMLFSQLTGWSGARVGKRFGAQAQLIVVMVKSVMRANRLVVTRADSLRAQALGKLVLANVENILDELVRQTAEKRK